MRHNANMAKSGDRPVWTRNWWTLGGAFAVLIAVVLAGTGLYVFTTRDEGPYVSSYVVPDAPTPATLTIPERPRVLFLGDSLTDGTASTDKAIGGFAPRLAAAEGWSDYRVNGVGLSGFLAPGISEDAHRNYRDRLQEIFFTNSYSPNVIVFQAGANDMSYPPAAVQSKVIETVVVSRKYWPDAAIVLIGPITSSTQLASVNSAYARGAYEADIPYVDSLRSPLIQADERAMLISADGWHPNDAGHSRIAERLEDRLAALSP